MDIKKLWKISLQYLAPQKFLSALAGWLSRQETIWLKNKLIKIFVTKFEQDLNFSEAIVDNPYSYASFHKLFTRTLRPGARTWPTLGIAALASPCDGSIYELGVMADGKFLKAKGHNFSVASLIADNNVAADFNQGQFMTIYLAPPDYHRVHMPINGELLRATYIPGALFSVNNFTVTNIPGVFARNERLVMHFATDHGEMLVIMVGAMLVGSIETSWAGNVKDWRSPSSDPGSDKKLAQLDYVKQGRSLQFQQGQDLGKFAMGSTVIILLSNKFQLAWLKDSEVQLQAGDRVRLGQVLATNGGANLSADQHTNLSVEN